MSQPEFTESQGIEHNPVEELDQLVLAILRDLKTCVMKNAEEAVERILALSSSYLNDKAKDALKEFNDLYFGKLKEQGVTDEINQDVDRVIDSIKKTISEGKDPYAANMVDEDHMLKERRLSISAIQKKLESIISLDAGIKKKLLPVLWNMQFEDMMRHRLNNIVVIWQIVTDYYAQNKNLDPEKIMEWLSKVPSSQQERKLFYDIVLKEEPPVGVEGQESIFDVLIFE